MGVLVIVLSVLGTVAVYARADDRVAVVAVRRTVVQGHLIPAADLTTVAVPRDTGLSIVPASQRLVLVGQIARIELAAGSLVNPDQVAHGPHVPDGMALAGATLKPGQYPVGLRSGDTVRVVEIPNTSATGDAAAPLDRGPAQVVELDQVDDSSSSIVVALVVPADAATAVAAAGASGRLTLIVVSAS
jgi:hypothetical protein